MEAGIGIIASGVFWALMGAVVSLIVLIPPIRRRARQHPRVAITFMSVTTFIIVFLSVSYLTARIITLFYPTITCGFPDQGCVSELPAQHQDAFTQEVWRQLLILAPAGQSCYTDDVEICQLVDDILSDAFFALPAFLAIALITAISCGYFVRRFLRPQNKKKKNEEIHKQNSPHL